MWAPRIYTWDATTRVNSISIQICTNCGIPWQIRFETKFALVLKSHGYILKAHMNEHTLLNNVMSLLTMAYSMIPLHSHVDSLTKNITFT